MTSRNRRRQPVLAPEPRRKIIPGILALFGIVLLVWHFTRPAFNDFLPVENVRIEGNFEHLPLTALRQQVMSVLSGGYFTVDIDAIRNTLLDLPWVEDVSVRRQWPSGLHIRVIEKQAVAFWGKHSLLSDRGEIFTPAEVGRDQSLPQLAGPDDFHQKVWAFFKDINREVEPMGVVVKRLELDERRAWNLSISNDSVLKSVEIRLGRANVAARLSRFVRIFSNNAEKLGDVGMIDLRYPNGFSMEVKNMSADSKSIEISHARKRGLRT